MYMGDSQNHFLYRPQKAVLLEQGQPQRGSSQLIETVMYGGWHKIHDCSQGVGLGVVSGRSGLGASSVRASTWQLMGRS